MYDRRQRIILNLFGLGYYVGLWGSITLLYSNPGHQPDSPMWIVYGALISLFTGVFFGFTYFGNPGTITLSHWMLLLMGGLALLFFRFAPNLTSSTLAYLVLSF